MTSVKIKARDLIVEVETTTDTWLRVENLANITINPSENVERADRTDFDSQGAYEEWIMQRGASMTLSGQDENDSSTGAAKPGRAQVETNAGEDKLGEDSIARYRFRHPRHTSWKIWEATTVLGEKGGDTNAISSWAATITKSGLTTTEAVE
ncbi:hypothetical protein AB0K05_24930 [Nonomuraea sp. NPDC049486]|uniref:phage tail tube protein n=1 Tax=Nonomuraea sp. NPDC049486 TaxID=3155773 RepID=UPI003446D719